VPASYVPRFDNETIICDSCEGIWDGVDAHRVDWTCPDCDEPLEILAEDRSGMRSRLKRLKPSDVRESILLMAPGAKLGVSGFVLAHSYQKAKYRIAIQGHGVINYADGEIFLNEVYGSWGDEDLEAINRNFTHRK
jgi:hypothetical protein